MEYRRCNLLGLPGEDHGGENLAGDGDARLGTGDVGTGDRSIVGLGMAYRLDLFGDCALGGRCPKCCPRNGICHRLRPFGVDSRLTSKASDDR